MGNQFQELFDFIDLHRAKLDLDFKEVKDLRNSISHGSPVGKMAELLNEVNK